MKESLQVTPILTYNTPKYPAYYEPNPLQISSKKGSKASFYKMVFLVVIGLFAFNNDAEAQTKENPIKFKEVNFKKNSLPHTYSMYGTGSLTYYREKLDRESSIAIIDSVFRANDIDLQKDYNFSEGELTFKTGGYDPELCAGYVWLDYENTRPDTFYSGMSYYLQEYLLPKDKERYQNVGEGGIYYMKEGKLVPVRKPLKSLLEKGYYKLILLQKFSANLQNEELQKEIADYLEKNPNKDDLNYGKEIYDKYTKELLNSEEIKAIMEAEDYSIAAFSRHEKCLTYLRGYETVYFEEESGKVIPKDSLQNLEGRKVITRKINNREKALQNLATFVQEYIDWAKSEGRF